MRIIHIIGALVAGGAERFIVDLLVSMKRMGLPVELVCLIPKRDPAGDKWAALLQQHGIPIHAGPADNLRPPTIQWLARFLKQSDLDIVHVHLTYTEAAYYLSRFLHQRKYRVVRTIHNTSMPEPGLWQWAFFHSDIRESISCGDACHKAYQGKVKGPLTCIPYGLEIDWPAQDPARRDERQRELGLDPALTHYLQVGRQSAPSLAGAQKAQDDLIKAWREGELGKAGGRLHLLGGGNLRPELEQLAQGDPSIVFEGVLPNVHQWMAACDTYVMPSRWEGLPLAGIEAVATGIPCVFSDIPPLRELGNVAATFHPVGDIEAIAQRLGERLGKRDTEPADSVAKLRERFGIDAAARAYRAVYERLT